MPKINTEKGPIWYADHRKKDNDATPTLLVHGAGASHLDWPPGLRRLPAANAIALDLPGHGKSPGPGRDTVAGYAEAIHALMDALELEQAIIAGHSMGGAIAQTMALTWPDRVKGLILIGTGARLPVNAMIIDGIRENKAETVGHIVKWMWARTVPDEMRELSYQRMMDCDAAIIQGDFLACDRFDVREQLGAITQPTLVIGGTDDKMTPLKFSETLADGIPNATLTTIDGGGHQMALEQPDVVVESIQTWLSGLD